MEVLHYVEQQRRELENKLSLASVEEFFNHSSNNNNKETFKERQVKEILESYGEREVERNMRYMRFSS